MSIERRKHFVFKKEKGHPLNSKSYRKTMEHIESLFRKEKLQEGAYISADLGVFSADRDHPIHKK